MLSHNSKMATAKTTIFSVVSYRATESSFSLLVFENPKTFKVFNERFNLLCKYNAKLNHYFVSIRLAEQNHYLLV